MDSIQISDIATLVLALFVLSAISRKQKQLRKKNMEKTTLTYEEYIKALDIVLRFHQSLEYTSKFVEQFYNNSIGTVLLSDFLQSLDDQSYYKTIKRYWPTHQGKFETCTVEYFIHEVVDKNLKRKTGTTGIRAISKRKLRGLIWEFETKGFSVPQNP